MLFLLQIKKIKIKVTVFIYFRIENFPDLSRAPCTSSQYSLEINISSLRVTGAAGCNLNSRVAVSYFSKTYFALQDIISAGNA